MTALDLSFMIGALLSLIAAIVSAFRGSTYIHGIHDAKSKESGGEPTVAKAESQAEIVVMDP